MTNQGKGFVFFILFGLLLPAQWFLWGVTANTAEEPLLVTGKPGKKEGTPPSNRRLSRNYSLKGDHTNALLFFKKHKTLNDTRLKEQTAQQIETLRTQLAGAREKLENAVRTRKQQLMGLRSSPRSGTTRVLLVGLVMVLGLSLVYSYRTRLRRRLIRALKKEVKEHLKTERKLRESEGKFRALAEQAVVGIYIYQGGRMIYTNPMLKTILGFPLDQLSEKTFRDFVHPEDLQVMLDLFTKRSRGDMEPIEYQFRSVTPEGEIRVFKAYSSGFLYKGQPAVIGVFLDVTRREKLEEELTVSRKLESIGILAQGIAHDFNNLLTVIKGNVELVRPENLRSETRARLELVLDIIARASLLTGKLLTFSQGGWLFEDRVYLADVFKAFRKHHPQYPLPPERVTAAPGLSPVYGSEHQLNLVLGCLFGVVNGGRGERENGDISIRAQDVSLQSSNPFGLEIGEYVEVALEVKRNGNGWTIPEALRSGLWRQLLVKPDSAKWNSPVLLYSVGYSIVKDHKGYLGFLDETGGGTGFLILLPADQRDGEGPMAR